LIKSQIRIKNKAEKTTKSETRGEIFKGHLSSKEVYRNLDFWLLLGDAKVTKN
jgi:hypothetical protein